MANSRGHPHQGTHRNALHSALLETAWPTRCVLCDAPGALLCKRCWLQLPFIDQSQACPHCGGPFGQTQCTECNNVILASAGLDRLPFQSCRSAFVLNDATRKIALTYKDGGERRLGATMARMIAPLANPSWLAGIQAVSYIPDTSAALRRRGFDHSYVLAKEIARLLNKPCLGLLTRPKATDQRALGRKDRLANMAHAFRENPAAHGRMPESILLIDDVITTGATLYAASQILTDSGVQAVRCLTFARAW